MKVLFDATFGESWVETIRSFFRLHKEPKPRILHLYDIFERDVKDDEWIPKLSDEQWLIVTADRGRGREPRLPDLCQQHRRTHILISATVHTKVGLFQMARAIIILWPDIVKTLSDKPGSRFQIRAVDAAHEHFRLFRKN